MENGETRLTSRNLKRAKTILFDVVELLEKHNIDYHLEGGTLLGIVRDKNLLPWDHDVDISIPIDKAESLLMLKRKLLLRGYKVSIRKSLQDFGPIKKGHYSILKIKPIWFYLLHVVYPKAKKNLIVLDVFLKTSDENYTYWQAQGKVMRVDKKYYESFEFVNALGRNFYAPNDYKKYLSEKYGNWSIPIKKWNCRDNEKTVCGDINTKDYPINN